jgi:hypothetical protein
VIQLLDMLDTPDTVVPLFALAGLVWLGIATVFLAALRTAAGADARMAAEDEAVAMAGPLGLLLSQTPSGQNVPYGPQQDLHVPPQRPVRDIQIIHRSHLA